ncbi:MAG: C40 family peptidase [Cyclobacteriaceae bacterium]|nr:C40 family peptidase [Cyclobacteriaceae bacterium]
MEEKGICRLSAVPIRKDPDHRSEMVSQLVFGEHYSVMEYSNDKQWLKVKNFFDDYVGWITANQHVVIPEDYFEQINASDYKTCLDVTSTILYNKSQVNIFMGSIIPIATNEIFQMEEQLAFNGEAKRLSEKRDADFINQMARRLLNSPYLWGGRTPFGLDCSGFVQLIFKIAGYKLHRDSYLQSGHGVSIESIEEVLPGDLAFFRNDEGHVEHVGIILEGHKIIHVHGKVKIDVLTGDGIKDNKTTRCSHHHPFYKRVINSR